MTNTPENRWENEANETLTGKFTGEEASSGYSSPQNDFISSAVVAVVGLGAMWMATKLDYPDTILTSPGVLPFFTGGCLIIMAAALLFSALRRKRAENSRKGVSISISSSKISSRQMRQTLVLGFIVLVYVLLLDQINFTWRYHTPLYTFNVGSFEVISIPLIAGILYYFWRGTIIKCFIISALMIFFLAIVFRDGFQILLPGSG
ncbi:MAG: tripartite tricarboxylate transporter TctB family protein [Pseudomonadota bacterium]|nr:tripartite tricarboxylate transporter TctB family protein [Pseudomonadota bacterium]